MFCSLFSNLLYSTWKHPVRHPGPKQSSSIKCRTLSKSRRASQARGTSTSSFQLFMISGYSVYSLVLNIFLSIWFVWLLLSHLNIWYPQPPCWLCQMPKAFQLKGKWPANHCSSSSLRVLPMTRFVAEGLFLMRKLLHSSDHPHCSLWSFVQLYFFWEEGKELQSLEDMGTQQHVF